MFLFIRLLLGHLIGDFLLQTDEVYRAKKSGMAGTILHAAIIFACLICFAFPYLSHWEIWLVLIIASLAHGFLDTVKLKYSNRKFEFLAFIIDQLLHVAFLTPVLLFPFSNHALEPETILAAYYNNDFLIVSALCAITSAIVGGYLWVALHYSFSLTPIEQGGADFKFGMFERFVITTSFLKPVFLFFLIIPIIRRIYLRKRFDFPEMMFNIIFASLIGICLLKLLSVQAN